MADGYFFNGRLWVTPATMSVVNDAAMAPVSLTTGNVLAILGQCDGGQPNTPLAFGNPQDALTQLVSGPLATAVAKAFNPSNDVAAPSTVIAIRVGQATPATLTLLDASSNQVISLVTNQYGLNANRTKVQVAAGSVMGSAVTVQVGNQYYTQDNISRSAFTVQYTGAAASAVMTINNSDVILQAPSGTQVASIPLATYPTIDQLVDAISAVPGFEATAIAGSGSTPSLNGLDSITAQNVKTAAYTAMANLQAVIDWFNGPGQGFVTATRVASAGAVPANIPWTYMAGGTSPAPQVSDWTNALTTLQSSNVQWVVPLTGDPAVHAAVDAHVQYMSTVAMKERRAFVGPVAGTTLAEAEALPLALNSDRTGVVWPGYYDYDATGVLTLMDPFYSAVLVAAGFAGMNPGDSMTNKSLTVRGLEVTLRNPTDTDALINAGICCLEATTTGFKVVRAISTWLDNDNYNRVEVSCGAAADFVSSNVRAALDVLRGGRVDPIALGRAEAITESALIQLAKPQPAGPGVIVGDATSPAYQGITASAMGDVIAVAFECSPVIPCNFLPVSISLVPYSGTASA